MVRFAHIADVHLGGWKQPEINELNMNNFRSAIEKCIREKVEFVLIAGDLFDSAYPPIETLKEAFAEFKKLFEAKIPCFIIAGSHDYSVSGKTFLDVLEKAGFCKNVFDSEEKDNRIVLNPTIYRGVAIYGYPGKRSGLEVRDLKRVKLNETPGMFRIFMVHSAIDKASGEYIESIRTDELPEADYYAMGHLHMDFQYENFVYPGPVFPNNFQELEDLQEGSFYIVDTDSEVPLKKIGLKSKGVVHINVSVSDALTATEKIISEINKKEVSDKIVLLRVKGILLKGRVSDVKFQQIEEIAKRKGAYFVLRNTYDLTTPEFDIDVEIKDSDDVEKETIKNYSSENNSKFNSYIAPLMEVLNKEREEDERVSVFEERIIDEAKKVLEF